MDELADTSYVLVNEDSLRLPQPINSGDSSISLRFIQNPAQVASLDDLYDMLEVNKSSPTKYIMIKKGSDPLSIQQKIFRKAYYENGSMFTDMLVFAEISNARIAKKVGIERDD